MIQFQVTVTHEVGLHARPASAFVKTASEFQSTIRVRNVTTDSDWVNAKSILSILTLGVEPNHDIEVELDGEDATSAAAALEELVKSNFPRE